MMLNPGGGINPLFNKSASTRMNNSITNGARATMPLNAMAQQSLRNQVTKQNPGPPVGQAPTADQQQLPFQPVQVPIGGPRLPEEASRDFDPAVFAEQQLEQIVEDIKQEQFMQSPRVKDAMESIRFKNLMNGENPRYQPDGRSLFRQVAARIGVGNA